VSCDKCSRVLEKAGALMFSPPTDRRVLKYNICGACWRKLALWLDGPGLAPILQDVLDTAARRAQAAPPDQRLAVECGVLRSRLMELIEP
jgi:hypothetical protein